MLFDQATLIWSDPLPGRDLAAERLHVIEGLCELAPCRWSWCGYHYRCWCDIWLTARAGEAIVNERDADVLRWAQGAHARPEDLPEGQIRTYEDLPPW